MITLSAPAHSLELTTSSVAAIHYQASWVDITTTTYIPDSSQGVISTATTTPIVVAPAASTQRQLKSIILYNAGTVANTLTIKKDVSATEYTLAAFTLAPGFSAVYTDIDGFKLKDSGGRLVVTDAQNSGNTGITSAIWKVGTAPEAAGSWYSWAKDAGNPGAWAPGTPGLAGRATDGTLAADNGCIRIPNAVGANYLTAADIVTSVACNPWLFDVLLVNSGIVVTTTTAQTLNTAALPARDANGTTNGEGVWVGLLVTTATTNAALNSTMTISYTNSAGVAGRTGIASTAYPYPATAVIGTVFWFQLAAGDVGVRSVQTITLAVSLTAGAVSLILARPIFNQAALVANVGGAATPIQSPGVRLYNGSCVLPIGLMSATTATTLSATVQIMDR
jgi:hypothetical protein